MGMQMAQGRNFSLDFPSDTTAALINEAAAREMGLQKPTGSTVLDFNTDNQQELTIVGVIKDFNFE